MNKTTIRTLYRQTPADGSVVTVYGWVRTVRDSKTFGFIELNDGTFFKNLQVVLVDGRLPNFKEAVKLTVGAAVKVKEKDASVSLKLPGGLGPQADSTCQTLLTALMVYLAGLSADYPDNIIVTEV